VRWRVAWVFGLILCASMMPEAIAESDALALTADEIDTADGGVIGKSTTDEGVTTIGKGTDSRVCLVRHDSKASLDKAFATSGGISFGAKSSVAECVDACAANSGCVQTIYDKAKGECYSTKAVTKGAGDGAGFTMMRCSKAPHLPTTKVCRIHKAQQLTSTDKQYQMDFEKVKYGAKAKTEEECLMPCTLTSACSQSAWSTKEQKCYPAKKASLLFSKKHGSGGYTIIQCVSNTPSAAAKEAAAKAAAGKQTAEKAKLAAEITQEKAKNEQKKKLLSQKQAASGAAEAKQTVTAVQEAKAALAKAKTDAEKKTAQENLKKAEKASADAQKASAAEKVKADKVKKDADASKAKAEAAKKKALAQESPKAQKADAKAQKETKKVEKDQAQLQKLEATEKDAVAQVSVALKTKKADKIAAAKKTHAEAKDKLAKFKVQIAQAKLTAQKAKLKAEQEAKKKPEKKQTKDKAAEAKKTVKAGKKKGGGQIVQPSQAEAKKALEAERKAQKVAKALAAEKRKEVTQELADKAEGKQKVAESGVKIEVVKQQLKKVKTMKTMKASQRRKLINAKKKILAKAKLLQKTRKASFVKLQKAGKEQAMEAAQAKESSKKAKLAAQTAKNQLALSRRASEKRMKSDQWYSKGALLFAQGVKYQGLLKQYQDAHNQLEAYQYNSELKTYVKAFPKGFTAPLRDKEAAPSKLIPAGSDSNLLKPGSVVVLQGGKRRRYCSDDEGSVKCDKKSFGKKEKFQVVSAKKGKVALKSLKSGKFCGQSGRKFSCSKSTIQRKESFKVHAADGGRIAFQAHNRRYCTDYGSKIHCSAKVVKRKQMFTAKCIKNCD